MSFNNGRLGNVVYNIYSKTSNGLKLLTSVSGNSATVTLPNEASPTLVVKSSYSNYNGCESSGVEVKVEYDGVSASDVTATLMGDSTVSLKLGDSYSEPLNPVKVTLEGENITDSDEVEISLTVLSAGNNVTNSWKTLIISTPGTYEFNYKVTYNGVRVTTLTRTVTVE